MGITISTGRAQMRHYNEFMDQWKRKDERYETFKRIRAQMPSDKQGKIYKIPTPEFIRRRRTTKKKTAHTSEKPDQAPIEMKREQSTKKHSEAIGGEAGIWMGHETKSPPESDSDVMTPVTESSSASPVESEAGEQFTPHRAQTSLQFGGGEWSGFSANEEEALDVESIL